MPEQPIEPTASDERVEQLRSALGALRERIEAACAASGRDSSGITLIVVTKFFPASDVIALHGLGVRDFGENRDQEAGEKFARVADAGASGHRVHFIGQLQTNKANHVGAYADVVHSLDRPRIVNAIARGAANAGRTIDALVQVSLDGRDTRGGAAPETVPELARAIAGHDSLRLRGVMAVAPLGEDPAAAFERLAAIAEQVREEHPGATWLSAGMSGDLEAAIAHGATHLRVGSAILGSRPTAK